MVLMHGTDAWLAECQSLRIIRTHALHGANSWSVEKLARSRVLNTRPLLATSLNPFYKSHYPAQCHVPHLWDGRRAGVFCMSVNGL